MDARVSAFTELRTIQKVEFRGDGDWAQWLGLWA